MAKKEKKTEPKKATTGPHERNQRRRRIASLLARGMNPDEIATMMGVSRNIVLSDLKRIRTDIASQVSGLGSKELAVGILGNLQEVLRAAWTLYSSAESESTRLNALRLIAKEEGHLIDILHSLGYGVPAGKSEDAYDAMADRTDRYTEEMLRGRLRSLLGDLEAGAGGSTD